MAYRETTWGELLDDAVERGDGVSEAFIRGVYRGWCKARDMNPESEVARNIWRAGIVEQGVGDNQPKIGD